MERFKNGESYRSSIIASMPQARSNSSQRSNTSVESAGLGGPANFEGNLALPTSVNALQADHDKYAIKLLTKLDPEGGIRPNSPLYNTIALIIHCEQHKRIALIHNERCKTLWFPFIPVENNKKWAEATRDCLSFLFAREDPEMDARLTTNFTTKSTFCMHIQRTQMPSSQKLITCLMQLVTLNSTDSVKCCSTNIKRVKWVDMEELANNRFKSDLWGPEVARLASLIGANKVSEISEYALDQAYYFLPKNKTPRNAEEEMLLSLGIDTPKIEKIYLHFLEYCFPSNHMTIASFTRYTLDHIRGFETPEKIFSLFQSMNFVCKGQIGFDEFLLGIISLEPACHTNESRLKFIFRYYCANAVKGFTPTEFGRLLTDAGASLALLNYQGLFTQAKPRLVWVDFFTLHKKGVIACHQLCRATQSTIDNMIAFFETRKHTTIANKREGAMRKAQTWRQSKAACLGCSNKKYKYGSHCVKLDAKGKCVEPRNVLEFDEEVEDPAEKSILKYSQEFMFGTLAQTFLDMIRDYNATKKVDNSTGFLTGLDCQLMVNYVCPNLCQNVMSLLEAQSKFIKINSPAYVVGDLRGSLDDLMRLEHMLWPSVPVLTSNFVFLGNYVNGNSGVECVLFLFALKICCPNKFVLLRGHNEIRHNQRNGFLQECLTKYGQQNGNIIWTQINDVFDRLTVAMVIDESVLCINNTLPNSSSFNLDSIHKLIKEVKEPLTCPISKEFFNNPNCTEDTILDFLNRHKLTHCIRSNHALAPGFAVNAQKRCLTISSAKTARVDPAIAFVDRPKIRIIKFDKTANSRNCKRSYFT